MWQSKREISRESNDIIGSYENPAQTGRGGGIYFLNETSACATESENAGLLHTNLATSPEPSSGSTSSVRDRKDKSVIFVFTKHILIDISYKKLALFNYSLRNVSIYKEKS
jgi:hypothetical protein